MKTYAAQDYLKTIYMLSEERGTTTGAIAERLGVAHPSATNMVKRLARDGLVRHAPYGPVELTAVGKRLALAIIRRHRLLELYLQNVLGLPLDRVHGEADQLEHALSDALAERLAQVLGDPDIDPHGEPIPGRRIA